MLSEGILCGNVVGGDSVWEYCRRGFCVGILSEGILCRNMVGGDFCVGMLSQGIFVGISVLSEGSFVGILSEGIS